VTYEEYAIKVVPQEAGYLFQKFRQTFSNDCDAAYDLLMVALETEMARHGEDWNGTANVAHIRHAAKCDRQNLRETLRCRPRMFSIHAYRNGEWCSRRFDEPIAPTDDVETLDDLFHSLDDTTGSVLRETILGDRTETEVADDMGLSRDQIARIKNKGKKMISAFLCKS